MAYNLEQINNKSIHNYKLQDHELPNKSIFQNKNNVFEYIQPEMHIAPKNI